MWRDARICRRHRYVLWPSHRRRCHRALGARRLALREAAGMSTAFLISVAWLLAGFLPTMLWIEPT